MTISLNANQCPLPLCRASFLSLNAAMTATGNAPVAQHIQADTANLPRHNRNYTALDLTGAYGGGLYGICYGLALSAGTGLTLNIASGHALIDGLVEIANGTLPGTEVANARTHTLDDNTARAWVWMLPNGTITHVNTSIAPPQAQACLLGSVTTVSGAITGIDTSGVVFLRGGIGVRQTNDSSAPTDTPSSRLVFLARTPTADFLWDGAQYMPLGGGGTAGHAIRKITASASVVTGDEAIWIDASGGNVTLTLPDATSGSVKYLVVKRLDSSSNTVTIAAASGQTIDGAASINLTMQYQTRILRAGQSAAPDMWGVE